MNSQEKINKYVIPGITESILNIIKYNWNNYQVSFYTWITYSCDSDFAYIYQTEFKRHFLVFFTPETDRILSYYSQNFANAVWSFYELNKNLETLELFIRKLIHAQFSNIDLEQLFMQ
jgi:hypothetical protein